MNILLTGASGYFGSALLAELLPAHRANLHRVTVLVRGDQAAQSGRSDVPTLREMDLHASTLRSRGIDTVIHLAAARSSTDIPAQNRSLELSRRLLEASAGADVRRLVLASSHAVYGTQPTPWDEDVTVPAPVTLYGLAKRATELMLDASPVSTVSARLAKLVGPSPRFRVQPSELPHVLLSYALKGKLVVMRNPKQRFDFLDVRDAVQGVIAIANHSGEGLPGAINLGSGGVVMSAEVAAMVDDVFRPMGFPLRYQFETESTPAPRDFGMSIKLAHRCLGWSPEIALRMTLEGIAGQWAIRAL